MKRGDADEITIYHEESELLPPPAATTTATTLKRDTSLDDLSLGVSVLLQLAASGTITADEGRRRKFLLQTYVAHSIQHGDEEEAEDNEEDVNSQNCCRRIHHWWRKFFHLVYYTEQVE